MTEHRHNINDPVHMTSDRSALLRCEVGGEVVHNVEGWMPNCGHKTKRLMPAHGSRWPMDLGKKRSEAGYRAGQCVTRVGAF